MTPAAAANGIEIRARREGAEGPLIPEEAALFEVTMRNGGAAPVVVHALDGSFSDPVVRVEDAAGKLLGSYPPSEKIVRALGDLHGVLPPPPQPKQLAPGEQEIWWANLWKYRDPLPPGGYGFQAQHRLADGAEWTVSPPVAFRIVGARVGASALGYAGTARTNSTLVWMGNPTEGSSPERMLVRESSQQSHAIVGEGATPLRGVPASARPSIGQMPVNGKLGFVHWIAFASGQGVEIVQQSFSNAQWRSKPVPLGLSDPLPVPRFPDRGHAVYLATGMGPRGPELVGVKVEPGKDNPVPWRVPLAHNPYLAAVSFEMQGPLVLLCAARSGDSTILSRVTVDENGHVLAPETTIRNSAARTLALAVDMRPGVPAKFLALEADPRAHDRITLVHIAIAGRVDAAPPAPLPGWPARIDGERTIPLPAREVSLEISGNGAPWVALTDEIQNLYAGSLIDFHLKLIRPGIRPSGTRRQAIHPHIGALPRSLTISCFTETGELFHHVAESHGGH